MLRSSAGILVRTITHGGRAVTAVALLAALAGCGQTGALYLPTEPAAARRATLPQALWPVMPDKAPASPSAPAPAPRASEPERSLPGPAPDSNR